MTRLFNRCGKCREDLCALLSGDLPAGQRAEVEDHVAACADCRRYRDEIGRVTALLAADREFFAEVGPRESTQARWAMEFEAALEPDPSMATRIWRGFLDWSRAMVWPRRRVWAGMAAVWMVILGLNLSQRGKEQGSHGPAPEVMRALLVREGFL